MTGSGGATAKDLRVEPISGRDARRIITRLHYSGKVDPRSQLHLGVFLGGRAHGAIQFGPSIDKSKTIGLVADTPWNGYLELNRLAFDEHLPRNSESRALAVAFRLLRRHAPHVEWVLSYADATQCGDGTIYRAAGFWLTNIAPNRSMWRMPDGDVVASIVFDPGFSPNAGPASIKARYGKVGSESSGRFLRRIGATRLDGYQLRYIKGLAPGVRERLTVDIIPYGRIAQVGASMYRGERPMDDER